MTNFLEEYLGLKNLYPDHLLFFRVGSFYELYFKDAELVARALNIALNYKKINNKQISSCGFPAGSIEIFSGRLLKIGFKIAISNHTICQNNSKKRQITQILTPGTIIEEDFVQEEENILLAMVLGNGKLHICFGDILLGNFYVDEIAPEHINQYLEDIKPTEILLENKDLIDQKFHSQATIQTSNQNLKIDKQIFEILGKHQNMALQAIFSYIATIHNAEILKHFNIKQFWQEEFLKISAQTRKNLQLTEVIKNINTYIKML